MDFSSFIISVLTEASHIANEKFGNVSGTTKPEDNNQVLTEADVLIGKTILQEIQKTYPAYNTIDEEAGVVDKVSEYTWVIDPIDGTSNFAQGVPLYGIYMGLLYKDIPIAGGFALPYFHEIYTAEKNKGAFCNGRKISVTKETNLFSSLIAYGFDGHPHDPEVTRKNCLLFAAMIDHVRNIRISNSAFDGAMVARGNYGGWLIQNSRIWDCVAVHCVIEEAGGVFTDFYGKPMNYTNALQRTKDNFTYCAASPAIHTQLQEIIYKNL